MVTLFGVAGSGFEVHIGDSESVSVLKKAITKKNTETIKRRVADEDEMKKDVNAGKIPVHVLVKLPDHVADTVWFRSELPLSRTIALNEQRNMLRNTAHWMAGGLTLCERFL
ncbi:hypothetical protein PHMEG_00022947 [Phytophthora megakarya]|uniref:Crinkler (CRN) n=1 Tax=Phytophthora megakarya TaxID=4795 RepID=A0A225VKI6_9STRA|nr:hypothetical protein PHMEG_00022947 [Phytophthora megakarya]